MKKNLIVIALALIIALPVFGLAAGAEALPEETQTIAYGGQFGRRWNQTALQATVTETLPAAETPAAPLGGQYSRRWNQTSPQAQQQPAFTDENKDGVCDICGMVQGTNKEAPGFTDTDGNGVCDNLGTDQQYQGRMGTMRGMGQGQKGRQVERQTFGGGRNRR